MLAATRGRIGTVRSLLRLGADMAQRDHDGLTALMLAAVERQDEVLRVLIAAGANVNTSNEGITPLGVPPSSATPTWPRCCCQLVPTFTPKPKTA